MLTNRTCVIALLAAISCGVMGCTSTGSSTSSGSGNSSISKKSTTLVGAPTATNAATKDDVVCRTQRKVGSHIPTRVCRTRAEMEAAQKAAMETFGPLRTMGGDELKRYR